MLERKCSDDAPVSNYHIAPSRLKKLSPLEWKTMQELDTLIEETKRPSVACVVDNSRSRLSMDVTQSRLGGRYAWPKNTAPPLEGDRVFCLIQVNLSDLPSDSKGALGLGEAREGLLQVFIRAGPDYGCDVEGHRGDGFRIVLHTDLHNMELSKPLAIITAEAEDSLPIGTQSEAMLSNGVPIVFLYKPSSKIYSNDYRFSNRILSVFYDSSSKTMCSTEFEEWCDDKRMQLDGAHVPVAWIGGHPKFCQEDIRIQHQECGFEPLVSFASDGGCFMWGDMGDATFMVSDNSKGNPLLQEAIYSWDCY